MSAQAALNDREVFKRLKYRGGGIPSGGRRCQWHLSFIPFRELVRLAQKLEDFEQSALASEDRGRHRNE
jgi:hypothetical protein